MNKFDRDLGILLTRLNSDVDKETEKQLNILRDRLIRLNEENVVKINHSVMELVCAKHLILKDYEVDIERPIDGLICDLYGVKGLGSHIVEVETGFIPPSHALDPANYRKSRIASKIIRYGNHSDKFALGVPPYYLLQIPTILVKPPRDRTMEDLKYLKTLCDLYYRNPPVTFDEIRNARIHTIYMIDVDGVAVREVDPATYLEKKSLFASA
ncbi:MAG: hypothetical protein JSW14_04115 [Candidatus Bathyarchaeum sp.]|nr:MAG: hypothetical protein JSW14_04115 [Candidatus Bathyarchaeum sp.]